jgi:hypothetical protein
MASGNESYLTHELKRVMMGSSINLGVDMSIVQQHPTPVRMPPDLKEWIKASAVANRRSMNAEIVTLLILAKEHLAKAAPMI